MISLFTLFHLLPSSLFVSQHLVDSLMPVDPFILSALVQAARVDAQHHATQQLQQQQAVQQNQQQEGPPREQQQQQQQSHQQQSESAEQPSASPHQVEKRQQERQERPEQEEWHESEQRAKYQEQQQQPPQQQHCKRRKWRRNDADHSISQSDCLTKYWFVYQGIEAERTAASDYCNHYWTVWYRWTHDDGKWMRLSWWRRGMSRRSFCSLSLFKRLSVGFMFGIHSILEAFNLRSLIF